MFESVDCLMFYVPDLDEGVKYYHDKLRLQIAWKSEDSIGFLMDDKKTEIVIQNKEKKEETDIKVKSVIETVEQIRRSGGKIISGPFDIKIGKCAVIEDPWGNRMVILDSTKGTFITDDKGNITGQSIKPMTIDELEAGLEYILLSPKDEGTLDLIVKRPDRGEREVMDSGELDTTCGLIGDGWFSRGSSRTKDGLAHPDTQITIMNSRVIELVTQDKSRWSLAGDQLYADLDLSEANLPPGTKLSLGTAEIVVTDQDHTGCKKFAEHFGSDAVKFINSPVWKDLKLRGINAKVMKSGIIRVGDILKKIESD